MESIGLKSEIRYVEARQEALHAYASHQKAKEVFNITSYTSLNDGLKKMADWAKKTGIKKSKKFEGIEIIEKLPPLWLENIE
jgi:UDP-glucose 4-epimerase